MSDQPAGRIEIVGLGPGDPDLRTVGTQQLLDEAERIVLRTARHPGIADLLADTRVSDCDDLYESGATFDEVYRSVAERVADLARRATGSVVYAVPGDPQFGERTVLLLRDLALGQGISLRVHPAVSAFDAIASTLGIDLMAAEAQVLDAAALVEVLEREPYAGGLVTVDPARPVVVGQVYATHVASAVKLTLSRLYPDDHPIVIVRAAAVPGQESVEDCRLFELDRRPVDHLTSVFIPPLDVLDATRSPYALQRIVARLRAPGGCPWDRKQTHQSLRDAIIEEAYETVDAIDAEDLPHLAEELGDVLLLVTMHAQIAEEAGDFGFEDVLDAVNRKLVRRHPHVFGDVSADSPEAVVATWDAVKAKERAEAANGAPVEPQSPLAKLPRSMPALQKARVLFGARKGSTPADVEDTAVQAAGEALLAAARDAAANGIDPEAALAAALERWYAPAGGVPAGDANDD